MCCSIDLVCVYYNIEFRMAEIRMDEFRIAEFRIAEFKMAEFLREFSHFKLTKFSNFFKTCARAFYLLFFIIKKVMCMFCAISLTFQ